VGVFSAITKLFRKDSQVVECCVDGVCNCSSDGNDLVSDSTVVTTTSTSSEVKVSSPSSTTSSTTAANSIQPVVTAVKPIVTATADEINIALETAAEADKLEEENYIPTLLPAAPPKKKRSNSKKSNLKLKRKSSIRDKKN